ncbi:hypothetical protein BU23DRAFT_456866, partial [Bimuria novae-zelandiae CBS 107.79]
EEFHFLVSSSQLCIVSNYFEAMVVHEFSEATPEAKGQNCHIKAHGLNPKAMEIILNIGHCQTAKVPRKIGDLELLTHLAVFVDFYHMHDAVALYSE